jgi:DNA-binding CsgD family transcriptional regulator
VLCTYGDTFLTYVPPVVCYNLWKKCVIRKGLFMGVRNKKRETLARLNSKTLDARFLNEIQNGLNCSPFESEAVLDVVKEVYFPFLDEQSVKAPPGKITLIAVSADEPAGKPVVDCEKQSVCLTIHRGSEDDRILQERGAAGFRQARIIDLCQEALSQGALLTREDLAYRVFFVSPRTITRDLNILREVDPDVMIPLRSTVHDIGPVLTHRTRIVHLALEGKTMTEICQTIKHSPQAVNNYLATFVRCVHLKRKGMQVGQIAFLLRRGKALVQQYLDIITECELDKNMSYHLEELMRLGTCSKWGEKSGGRRDHD